MAITIRVSNYRCFGQQPVEFSLEPGSTAFIGKNNAGKSTILRLFIELRGLFAQISDNSSLLNSLSGRSQAFNLSHVPDIAELFNNSNTGPITISLILDLITLEFTIPRDENTFVSKVILNNKVMPKEQPTPSLSDRLLTIGNHTIDISMFQSFARDIVQSMYIPSFRNIINVGGNSTYYDISIGQQFIEQWRNYKLNTNKRQQQVVGDISRSLEAIFGFNRLEINAANNNETLMLTIDHKPYRLAEIGSGFAQFVLVLLNVALKRPAYVFIDEPEISLHPSLQIEFLNAIENLASRGVTFGTHSYGLAKAFAERIYVVQLTNNKGTIHPIETVPRLSLLLGELSYSGHSEVGFDKVLLVEGPTEVKTIQQFLRKLGKDHKIMLLPLGGSSLINGGRQLELEEIKRINTEIYALIDSEKSNRDADLEKSRKEFVAACKAANVDCHVLTRRATENYLTDKAAKQVNAKYVAPTEYEKLDGTKHGWSKADNWRLAQMMDWDEIKDTDLGRFLGGL